MLTAVRSRANSKKIGKLTSTLATTESGVNEITSFRLFIKDRTTGLNFLIDTGANVSVLPARKLDKKQHVPTNYFYAANGSSIPAYGERIVLLNLGLRRPYKWTFVIAAVQRPILGADFLHHHNLMVDLTGKKLIDGKTNLCIQGSIHSASQGSLRTIDTNKPYHDLLAKYPDITRPTLKILSNSEVEHHIETNGPPVFPKSRPLPPHKLKPGKEEFQQMIEQEICRPSSSPWSSPLHMAPK
ncbi:uncharacterized protein LOC128678914 [Plodia interpunctella]|uniref:uncharacterized protein LOC128678914 n=1 Tax=Plodia interpunctella TaxID=58824 RepID=UPI0023688A25|nr:uncharacterized protein LOC128678914 [Plodia interpunctella]